MPASIDGERPLNRATRVALVLGAAGTILLFYVAAVASMVLLAVIVFLLVVLMLGATRIGLSRFVSPYIARQATLLRIFGRNFWLTSSPTFRLVLQPEDAPRLFAVLRELSGRAGVEPPHEVSVEMNCGAWVQLRGYRRGAGKTSLGVGYDLLAGLSEGQVEAVLAHELAHAKLVQRGVSRWLQKGLARLTGLSGEISRHADACGAAKERSMLADGLLKVFDALGVRAVRLVATYSRQNEFEADRGAAEISGAGAMRSSLIRLESLNASVARLPWSERVARVHPAESFSAWLAGELALSHEGEASLLPVHAVDQYSTHPSLADRIAALPEAGSTTLNQRPGIELLADPDHVAERLMTEIQRVLADLEAKDTKAVARDARKLSVSGRIRPLQLIGVTLLVGGSIIGMVALFDGFPVDMLVTATVTLALGTFLYRRARYRDQTPLPVPAYGTLTGPMPGPTAQELSVREKQIEADLRTRIGEIRAKLNRLEALVAECYSALGDGDYVRAHVAARLAIDIDKRSVEAGLGYAVAAAGLGNAKQASDRLAVVRYEAGDRTRNVKWGIAWVFALLGDSSRWNEGILAQLHAMDPTEPTFMSLLALVQHRRGKTQSAARNAVSACALDPTNHEIEKLLINVLIGAGRAREAADRLRRLEHVAPTDTDVMLAMVRVNLMLRDTHAAREWSERMRAAEDGRWLVALGQQFELARLDADATAYYDDALSLAFYPEAHMGLARIDSARGDAEGARRHLLSALNFDREVPPHTQGPAALFHDVLAQLNSLAGAREACTRWIVTMPADASVPLAGRSLMVCAASEAAATAYLQTIVSAMQPDAVRAEPPKTQWRQAPKDQQPVRPLHPGVEFVLA